MDIMTYTIVAIVIVIFAFYIITQIKLSKKIALKDTTLENIEEKLKKHKLIGGRHKRTNKKNPPIV
ncbi:MAG: hypothetical protein ACJ0QZ_02125 [Gammaproteobacteria bacterium]|tara:strand:- start:182 stop:379 length:198 start_codon:yes stop_codon:yes gene_type:complete